MDTTSCVDTLSAAKSLGILPVDLQPDTPSPTFASSRAESNSSPDTDDGEIGGGGGGARVMRQRSPSQRLADAAANEVRLSLRQMRLSGEFDPRALDEARATQALEDEIVHAPKKQIPRSLSGRNLAAAASDSADGSGGGGGAGGGGAGAGGAKPHPVSPRSKQIENNVIPDLLESHPLTPAEQANWAAVQRCFARAAAGDADPFAHLPMSGKTKKQANRTPSTKDRQEQAVLLANMATYAHCVVATAARPRGLLPAECHRRYTRAEGWGGEPKGCPTNIREVCDKLALMLAWRGSVGARGMLRPGDGANALGAAGATEKLRALWPSFACGTDRIGHILHVESLKHIQVKAIRTTLPLDVMLAHRARCHESMSRLRARRARREGFVMHKSIYVCDLSGLSMSYIKPSWIKWLKPIFAQGSEYYPETLWRMYLVNAPWVVKSLWKIIKVWIDPETLAKIGIYGGPKVFRAAMQKDGIDPDILPGWLGGKGTAELVSLPIPVGEDEPGGDWPV